LEIGVTTRCATRYYNAVLTPINQRIQSVSRCYNRLYVLLHVSYMFDTCNTQQQHATRKQVYTLQWSIIISH